VTATIKTTVIKDATSATDNITLDSSGNATVGAGLTVTGASTLSSTLAVTGASTLSSTLAVTGTTTLSSTLAVTGTTTLSGDASFGGAIDETVYNLTGTALDPSNGTIQYKTLSANTTLTDSIAAGEAMTLMINDGTAYTVTWPTMTWVNNGGSAPTLATTGYTVVALWKVSTTLYGALVGDGS